MKFISTYKDFLYENLNYTYTLYHGTKKDFDSFDLNYFNTGSYDGGWLGYGVYLTNDYEYAESYGNVLECKVVLNNPYILESSAYSLSPNKLNNELQTYNSRETTKKLKELGYDSILLKYVDESYKWLDEFIEVCVFDPSSIEILQRYEHGDNSNIVNHKRGYDV